MASTPDQQRDPQPEPPQGSRLTLADYQRRALETSYLPLDGAHAAVPPMLGLASETGAILDSHKRYLRDRIDLRANREFLREELGDLLWYTSAVATASGLDLADIAEHNLRRARDLYGRAAVDTATRLKELPHLDSGYPDEERFPRVLVVEFAEVVGPAGRPTALLHLRDAVPNAFPSGPQQVEARQRGFAIGAPLGAQLTDHSRRADAYRFHDAIHMAFMAVLGWSPTMRALLNIKRRSDADAEHGEDSARAVFAEEGITSILSRFAPRRLGFLSEPSVDGDVLDAVQAITRDLEVGQLPGWAWRRAISQGFFAMKMLADNTGGFLVADLDARDLSYSNVMPEVRPASDDSTRKGPHAFTGPALLDATIRLHAAKTRMYGDAWKRRGEVLSVLSNLARKVDRLSVAVHGRASGTADGETDLDTAVDLLVYSVKYQTFLADIDVSCARELYADRDDLPSPYSDGLDGFEHVLTRQGVRELGGVLDVRTAVDGVLTCFQRLETCFNGVIAEATPLARLGHARDLARAAVTAVGALAAADPASYRRFLATDRGTPRGTR